MGAIQSSINKGLAAGASALAINKHFKEQEKANEISKNTLEEAKKQNEYNTNLQKLKIQMESADYEGKALEQDERVFKAFCDKDDLESQQSRLSSLRKTPETKVLLAINQMELDKATAVYKHEEKTMKLIKKNIKIRKDFLKNKFGGNK